MYELKLLFLKIWIENVCITLTYDCESLEDTYSNTSVYDSFLIYFEVYIHNCFVKRYL